MTARDVADSSPREQMRLLVDRVFASSMAVGGVSVIVAILLIFFYLLYTVLPLFSGASIEPRATLSSPNGAAAAFVTLDEYSELALVVDNAGGYRFIRTADNREVLAGELLDAASSGSSISAIAAGDPAAKALFAATADGRVIISAAEYTVSYPDDQRHIEPGLAFPYGPEPHALAPGESVRVIAGQAGEEEASVAAATDAGRLLLLNITKQTSFLDDEVTFDATVSEIDLDGNDVARLVLDVDQRELYVLSTNGSLMLYDVADKANPRLLDRVSAVQNGYRVTDIAMLSGGISIVTGDDSGALTQWFPLRDTLNNYTIAKVREFEPMPGGVSRIAPEHFRKGFAVVDDGGRLALYHATAARQLELTETALEGISALGMGPRADSAIVARGNEYRLFEVDNHHPEVSWRALWGKVWYESRAEPEYIWQSSSASADFEPKFSLTPLTFGTLKATIYSMLFAMPLAVFGAIYTAYFMSAPMRAIVKPAIEVMAALPTVILGFLAGLWLAPLIEKELVGVFIAIAAIPLLIFAAAYGWSRVPSRWRHAIPDGWEAVLLIPVICFAFWLSFEIGKAIEIGLLGGSAPHWLHTNWGITYDQRNSLVVGIAIGFAVIPTIFTISEDAVFSVPRSLTMGSLALGATPWQTAIKVVLLTASPGIFSAVMIGMGRAVGETMIVLMATGNTPIMDINIFQGFRALSANIAVEMPESEVDSTHYRILFLAALVLFMVTFVVNTAAEIVRQRLRRKYASL